MLEINELKELREKAVIRMKKSICSRKIYNKLENSIKDAVADGWSEITVTLEPYHHDKSWPLPININNIIIERKNSDIMIKLPDNKFGALFSQSSGLIDLYDITATISNHFIEMGFGRKVRNFICYFTINIIKEN